MAKETDTITRGKELLAAMRFVPAITSNFGYPFLCEIPGDSETKTGQNAAAIRAFLETTDLHEGTKLGGERGDYEWSHHHDKPRLNIQDRGAIARVLGKASAQVKE